MASAGRGGGGGRGGGRGGGSGGAGGGRGGGGGQARGPGGVCVCSGCGHEQPHQAGVPCFRLICPTCGEPLTRKD